MSVLNKEQFMARLKEVIGDDTSDESMTFIEDMTDTYNDMETKSNTDYEKKYNETVAEKEKLDKEWREKYRSRFFDSAGDNITTPDDVKDEQKKDVIDDGEKVSIEDLFEEREG